VPLMFAQVAVIAALVKLLEPHASHHDRRRSVCRTFEALRFDYVRARPQVVLAAK
jgi:hypothetical protein